MPRSSVIEADTCTQPVSQGSPCHELSSDPLTGSAVKFKFGAFYNKMHCHVIAALHHTPFSSVDEHILWKLRLLLGVLELSFASSHSLEVSAS